MPIMSRSLDVEFSTIKEMNDLEHSLARDHINLPKGVLQRAIVIPNDTGSPRRYITPYSTLPIKPHLDQDFLRKQALIDGTKLGLTP